MHYNDRNFSLTVGAKYTDKGEPCFDFHVFERIGKDDDDLKIIIGEITGKEMLDYIQSACLEDAIVKEILRDYVHRTTS